MLLTFFFAVCMFLKCFSPFLCILLLEPVLHLLKARADIREVHFLPFNPTDKRTALTYLDAAGKMHRVSKGAPEQVYVLLTFNINMIVLQDKLLHIKFRSF